MYTMYLYRMLLRLTVNFVVIEIRFLSRIFLIFQRVNILVSFSFYPLNSPSLSLRLSMKFFILNPSLSYQLPIQGCLRGTKCFFSSSVATQVNSSLSIYINCLKNL